MKKITVVLGFCGYLFSSGFDLSVFNTPLPDKNSITKKECYKVCKPKLTKVQKLKKAIEFYKNSKYYKFSSSSKNLSK